MVGGFYRVHQDRSVDEKTSMRRAWNLCRLRFAQQHAVPDMRAKPGTAAPNRFYMYGVVARLAFWRRLWSWKN